MKYTGPFDGRSVGRADGTFGRFDGLTEGRRGPDPRDPSPIEDPRWPYVTPSFPKRPFRMSEDDSDRQPPRSPKTAWPDRPPRSPKDVPESDKPRSPKSPDHGFRRSRGNSGDFC